MPRLLLVVTALLMAPITLSMANPPQRPAAPSVAASMAPEASPSAEAGALTDEEGRRLVAAALLVALEWGRR